MSQEADEAYIRNLEQILFELRLAVRDVMAHDFVEECQECAVGKSPEWEKLKSLMEGWGKP
jgi:hypothetical protein